MRQAELERISAGRYRELVHETLAGEHVRCGREGAIGAVPQRRLGLHVLAFIFRDTVRRFDAWLAGVDVYEMPGRDVALVVDAGLHVDRAGGAEVGPGEFFGTRP